MGPTFEVIIKILILQKNYLLKVIILVNVNKNGKIILEKNLILLFMKKERKHGIKISEMIHMILRVIESIFSKNKKKKIII